MNARPTLREESASDGQAIRAVIERAFGEHGKTVASLVDALQGHRELSLVAERDGRVVGHVQLSRSWIDARERLVEIVILSPLAVLPEHQSRGIGGALIRAAVAQADARRWPAVFLEGSPIYYARHGFERAAGHGFLRPSLRIPERAFQVVKLSAHEAWMTGAIVYCEPFWRLDCVGLRDPRLKEIEELQSAALGRASE